MLGEVNFSTQFCLGSISNGFGATNAREVSLKGNTPIFELTMLINLTYETFTNIY